MTAVEQEHYRRLIESEVAWADLVHPGYGGCDMLGEGGVCSVCLDVFGALKAEVERLSGIVRQMALLVADESVPAPRTHKPTLPIGSR